MNTKQNYREWTIYRL